MRHAACLLLLLACLVALPGAAPVPSSPVELAYLRTATSRTWVNPDGSYTGEFHVDADPIHRWVPLLGWVPVDSWEGPILAATGLILADSYFNQDFAVTAGGSGQVWVTNATWATARGAASGTVLAGVVNTSSNVVAGPSFNIGRTFLPCNTAALDDAAVVRSGVYRIYPTGSGDASAAKSIYLVPTTQASGTTLATTDYPLWTATDYGHITVASMTLNQWNDMTITAACAAAVSTTGYTKLALVHQWDFDNAAPTGAPPKNNFISNNSPGWPTLRLNYDIVYQRGKGCW